MERRKSAEKVFGIEVAQLRKRLGISQEELGFRTGLHRTYVSQIERGIKSPTLGVILKFASALEVSPAKLVATVEKKL